jgi:catechol 2,3-dioxygenase-like lactoylglutathione lyase family enzyme
MRAPAADCVPAIRLPYSYLVWQADGAAHTVGMPVRLHHIVVDARDLPGLARFWTQALGWKILSERENEIVIGADDDAPVGMCFMPVTDPKTVKNRVHLDLTSSAADRDQEIDRLLALGARRVDIGQTGAESWTVLADPEGNEFCVGPTEGNAHLISPGTASRRRTPSGHDPDIYTLTAAHNHADLASQQGCGSGPNAERALSRSACAPTPAPTPAAHAGGRISDADGIRGTPR